MGSKDWKNIFVVNMLKNISIWQIKYTYNYSTNDLLLISSMLLHLIYFIFGGTSGAMSPYDRRKIQSPFYRNDVNQNDTHYANNINLQSRFCSLPCPSPSETQKPKNQIPFWLHQEPVGAPKIGSLLEGRRRFWGARLVWSLFILLFLMEEIGFSF